MSAFYRLGVWLCMLVGLCGIGPLRAQNLVNGSFEVGVDPNSLGQNNIGLFAGDRSSLPGWTVTSGSVDYIGSRWQAAQGSRSLDLSGSSPGTVSQMVDGFVVGQTYEFGFALAGNPEGGPPTKTMRVGLGDLVRSFIFGVQGTTPSRMGWIRMSFEFVATATVLNLSFSGLDAGAWGAVIDDVSIHAVPPPPPPPPSPALNFMAATAPFLRDAPLAVSWGDYDGDGAPDIAFASLTGGASLFRRSGSAWQSVSGLLPGASQLRAIGVSWVDYDNDGDLDLFVLCSGGSGHRLYSNLGNGTFGVDLANAALTQASQGASAVWGDANRDGWLDVILVNGDGASQAFASYFRGAPEGLFRRVDQREFASLRHYGTAGSWADYDGDGDLDFVALSAWNDVSPFYANSGTGDLVRKVPSPLALVGAPTGGSGLAWCDYDNDGDLDVFVAATGGKAGLFRNSGRGSFELVAAAPSFAPGALVGAAWADFDNDGWPDLVVANREGRPLLYRGSANGSFERIVEGPLPTQTDVSNGLSIADMNGDGRLDVAFANWPAASPSVYENVGAAGNFLRIRLNGVASNREGRGAKVRVTGQLRGTRITQLRQMGGEDAWGTQECVAHFGLGDGSSVDSVEVEWPSGTSSFLQDVAINRTLVISEPVAPALRIVSPPVGGEVLVDGTISLTVQASGNGPLTYRWFFESSLISGANEPTLTLSSVRSAQSGAYRVEVSNSSGLTASATAFVTVLPVPLPVIGIGPSPVEVEAGGTATFVVWATGRGALKYHWFRNGIWIENATGPRLDIPRVQTSDAGLYFVEVLDDFGVSRSGSAALKVLSPPSVAEFEIGDLINVDFGSERTSRKVGLAATGRSASDFWNTYQRRTIAGEALGWGSVPNLRRSNGQATFVRLAVENAGGVFENGVADPMYGQAVGSTDGSASVVSLEGVPSGAYDLYLYGHGGAGNPPANTVFEVVSSGASQGVRSTTTGSGWNTAVWREGDQFVVFRGVRVDGSRQLSFRATKGTGDRGFLAGLQLVRVPAVVAPLIVEQPVGGNALVGSGFEFSVTATGTGPLEYRWYVNDRVVVGATNRVLSLSNLGAAQAGTYRVIVFNAAGAVDSGPAVLTVVTGMVAPEIVVQPRSRSLLVGQALVLSVTVTGSAPLTYRWIHDDLVVSGATGPELRVPSSRVSDSGLYYVEVANHAGRVKSETVAVSVAEPQVAPFVTSQPKSVTVAEEETAVLVASAGGTEPLRWQWYRDDQALPDAKQPVLTLSSAIPAQSGRYRAEISNAVGTVATETVIVTVTPRPPPLGGSVLFVNFLTGTLDAPVTGPDRVTRLAGEGYVAQLYAGTTQAPLLPVGAVCVFRSGDGAGYWNPGPDPVRYIPSVRAGDSVVVQVRAWRLSDGSTYEAAAAAGGMVGESAYVTMTTGGAGIPPSLPGTIPGLQGFSLRLGPPPLLARPLVGGSPLVGESFQLEVAATGPSLTYQWFRDGTAIQGATRAIYPIAAVGLSDAGRYQVVVRNLGGSVTSSEVEVVVRWLQAIRLGPVASVQEGGRVQVPVKLVSAGNLGSGSFRIRFDPALLLEPSMTWGSVASSGPVQATQPRPGELELSFARGRGAYPAGEVVLGTLGFRARSLASDATTRVAVENLQFTDATGGPLRTGTMAEGVEFGVIRRGVIGDSNGNQRLDVGDAVVILGFLSGPEIPQAWDRTGNDVNRSGGLDLGDAIRILRVDTGLDPVGSQAPAIYRVGPGGEERLAGGVSSAVTVSDALYRFSLDSSSGAAGSLVRVRIHLLPGADGLAGVSFALRYDPSALRPRTVTDLRLGALVPASALVLWNPAADSALAAAPGVIRFAAATARSWPTDEGLLAEVQFEVQSTAAERVLWPIVLERFEVTRSGYDLVSGAAGTLNFRGREVRPLQLHSVARPSDGAWGVQITGEPKSRIRVEASSDLVDWVVERDLDLDGDGVVRFLPGNGSAGGGTASKEASRFYRAQLRE